MYIDKFAVILGSMERGGKSFVLKVSCRWTDNLSARYNDHQKVYSIMISLI